MENNEDLSGIITEGSETFQFNCPVCNSDKAVINQRLLQIPYFTDFHAVTIICPTCGLKKADFSNINSQGPTRYEYSVTSIDDFSTKVVRSIDGVVSIPEIGIEIKPATAPASWIRNIEGILLDMKEKVEIVRNSPSNEQMLQAAIERLELIDEVLTGQIPITIIVADPNGNSIIIPVDEKKLLIEKIDDFDPYDDNFSLN
jgi:zinc finger protein